MKHSELHAAVRAQVGGEFITTTIELCSYPDNTQTEPVMSVSVYVAGLGEHACYKAPTLEAALQEATAAIAKHAARKAAKSGGAIAADAAQDEPSPHDTTPGMPAIELPAHDIELGGEG